MERAMAVTVYSRAQHGMETALVTITVKVHNGAGGFFINGFPHQEGRASHLRISDTLRALEKQANETTRADTRKRRKAYCEEQQLTIYVRSSLPLESSA